MADIQQAPEEIVKKFVDFGFKVTFQEIQVLTAVVKKLWINKEYQRFQKTFANYIKDGMVPISTFLEKTGSDELEAKVFSFLFDANGDGVISFEEVGTQRLAVH